MPFLPEDYKIPQSPSGYMKLEEGLNSIRVLSSAIVGYKYFSQDNKSIRSKTPFEELPRDIRKDEKIKPFWAFVIFNNNLKLVQIMEVTQKSIMNGIKALLDNPKWGDPKNYDIAITRTGEGLDTEYVVNGEPPIGEPSLEIKALYKAKFVNLEALFIGADPFTKSETPTPLATRNELTIEIGDLPK